MKFYAVATGRKTGIFTTWPEAERQVKGFPGAKYKSFKTRADALAFLENPAYGKRKKTKRTKAASTSSAPTIPEAYTNETIVVYTDGGAIGNPGPGGYGVVFKNGETLCGGFNKTTNNRMELLAVIKALEVLEGTTDPIILHSDSRYVINGITKGWAKGWKKRGWKKSNGEPAMNPDLWATVLERLAGLNIRFKWVKGHAGNPMNEAADHLANSMAKKTGLPDDIEYLKSIANSSSV